MQVLNLIELSLVCCPYVPETSIRQCALTALQRLHNEDGDTIGQISEDDEATESLSETSLCCLGDTVMSLPSIAQFSGECELFFYMAGSLGEWRRCDYKRGSMASLEYCSTELLWLKPL